MTIFKICLKAQQTMDSDTELSGTPKNFKYFITMVFLKGLFILAIAATLVDSAVISKSKNKRASAASKVNELPTTAVKANTTIPCTCGVFLNGQFVRGSDEQPKGDPALIQEINVVFPCNAIGQKQCQTKCLEAIVGHLPNSGNVLCAVIDRDCRKERAYLFIKNCKDSWVNTNLAAGKEYCCKDGQSYPCPLV